MAGNNLIDEMWLGGIIHKQKCRDELFGDSSNPLAEKIKKKQKHIKESLISDKSVEYKALCFNADSKSKLQPSTTKEVPILMPSANQFISQKVDQDKQKKKQKKKQKSKKKQLENAQMALFDSLLEVDSKNSNLMAEVIKHANEMVIVNDELYLYNADTGCYKKSSPRDIAKELRSSLEPDDQLKITSRQYKESYDQLMISGELESKDGFFENRPYVNCLNGVVDVCDEKLLKHSPDFCFKHCINANYVPGKGKCERFLEYLDYITGGQKDLKRLLRVLMGYLWSHYTNGKVAVLVYGIPGTGKSVLCALIERVIGGDVSHVDLTMLHRPEFAANLSNKLLNIAPDLKNEALKDVGFFKSLVSHDDTISTRALYDNPRDIKCETKMMFSSNHLLTFDSSLALYDIEAVFNRLIYFPFQNKPITKDQDNKHLSDELYEERDLIFTWAMKGLKDYVANNETFPEAKASNDIKRMNMARYCPEKIFYDECIKEAVGKYESSGAIKDAFMSFCRDNDVSTKADIANFLDEHQRIPKTKKRIDADGNLISSGNPIHVYEGILLKKQYRTGGIEL